MDTTIIVAIIVGVSAVIAAIIAAYGTANAASRKLAISLAGITVKVNTLWEIYAEEAIREARTTGMVAARSREKPTEKLNGAVPDSLRIEIEEEITNITSIMHSPYDIAIEIWTKHSKELLIISEEEDIPPSALFGTIYLMCVNGVADAG
jgi:hypothetical protein